MFFRSAANVGKLSTCRAYSGKTLVNYLHTSKIAQEPSLNLSPDCFEEDRNNSGKAIKSLFDKFTNNVKPEHVQGFNLALPSLTENVISLQTFRSVSDRLKKIIVYNSVPTTQYCGMQVLGANQFFEEWNSGSTNACRQETYALAWACEWIASSFYMMNDIADGSDVRYRKPSWHSVQGSERFHATYDAGLLERAALALVANTFANHKGTMYLQLASLFQKTLSMCSASCVLENVVNSNFQNSGALCTMENYCWMRKQQNGSTLCVLPITAAAIVNDVVDTAILKQLEGVCMDILLYYAIAKDMTEICEGLSSLGDEMTDIRNGRITWPLITAVAEASAAQRQALMENIGKANEASVQRVLGIYEDLKITILHARWQTELYERTSENISRLSPQLPRQLLQNILDAFRTAVI